MPRLERRLMDGGQRRIQRSCSQVAGRGLCGGGFSRIPRTRWCFECGGSGAVKPCEFVMCSRGAAPKRFDNVMQSSAVKELHRASQTLQMRQRFDNVICVHCCLIVCVCCCGINTIQQRQTERAQTRGRACTVHLGREAHEHCFQHARRA